MLLRLRGNCEGVPLIGTADRPIGLIGSCSGYDAMRRDDAACCISGVVHKQRVLPCNTERAVYAGWKVVVAAVISKCQVIRKEDIGAKPPSVGLQKKP